MQKAKSQASSTWRGLQGTSGLRVGGRLADVAALGSGI